MNGPADYDNAARVLSIWAELVCVPLKISSWSSEHPADYDLLFWDLDGKDTPPVQSTHNLILCSQMPQTAITSYTLHPIAFLRKPVRLDGLQSAMDRCTNLWWPFLERLEILSGHLHLHLPICGLVWIEGGSRGSLLHSSQESIFTRETLSSLEQRLPRTLFLRCQRSFLVNLFHVRSLDSGGVYMSDGTVIPFSRSGKRSIEEAYRCFCLWKNGGIPDSNGEVAMF